MTSSSDEDTRRWGTIFMGPSRLHETSLDMLKDKEDNQLWTERTEAEYLARVRQKAVVHAKKVLRLVKTHCEDVRSQARADAREILKQADIMKTDAEMRQHDAEACRREAEALRNEAQQVHDAAHQQGYADGIAQAEQELELFRAELGVAAASVIQTIGSQCQSIYEKWREELVLLLLAAVEKSTGMVLSVDRTAMLENMFMLAVHATANTRNITVRVNPDDAPLLVPIIEHAKKAYPAMQLACAEDASIAAGGLVLDSEYGRVEHGVEHCKSVVEDILRNLSLPNTEVDTLAVSNALEKAHEVSEPLAALQGVLDKSYGQSDAAQPDEQSALAELHMPPVPDLDAFAGVQDAPLAAAAPTMPGIGAEIQSDLHSVQDPVENVDFDGAPTAFVDTDTDHASDIPESSAVMPDPSPQSLSPEELEQALVDILPVEGERAPEFFGAAVAGSESAHSEQSISIATEDELAGAVDVAAFTDLGHEQQPDDVPVIAIEDEEPSL